MSWGGLHALDWAILVVYLAGMFWIGVRYAGRAGKNLDEFFLSGRSLPWWLTGTSMVATSFSCDTPLVISGWVRDGGIWKNWVWWCFAISGSLQVFLFARWWRKAGVMTKAELVELRYGGRDARFLRGTLGVLHALVTNTIIMGWVLLSAIKISGTLFGVDKLAALVASSVIVLAYCVMAGMWGVVLTDFFQFGIAMAGAIVLGCVAWGEIGGSAGVLAAAERGALGPDTLAFFPAPGPGTLSDASFWTIPFTALVVYLGVAWWAVESVDGAGAAVQRIAASRNEREGVLATLWFNVAHYALRPWFWIMVALASLVLVPPLEVRAGAGGVVRSVDAETIVLEQGAALETFPLAGEADWKPAPLATLESGDEVEAGELLARTDPEAAYVIMLRRYLPIGLFGLMIASLLAAFMSTIDTHINLAASFFVNDVYKRFLRPDASMGHYVLVARLASVAALALAGIVAWQADSISAMFLFFLSLLGGVGPVYLMRWLWWRVRASTEIVAMSASALTTSALSWLELDWPEGPLTSGGVLSPEGRLLLVVLVSVACALFSMLVTRAPDPATLVPFYRRVRPIGAWGPVRALAGEGGEERDLAPALVGSFGGVLLIFGLTLAPGCFLLRRFGALGISLVVAAVGTIAVAWALKRLFSSDAASPPSP